MSIPKKRILKKAIKKLKQSQGVKLLVVGLAQHGKDTVTEILRDSYRLSYKSSSVACIELFIFDKIGAKYGYKTPLELYQNRDKYREELYQLITEFNTPDKSKLARLIMESNQIYCGLRSAEELEACKASKVFDMVIWVDALQRKGVTEGVESNTITEAMTDCTIDNNGAEKNLEKEVRKMLAFYIQQCKMNLS